MNGTPAYHPLFKTVLPSDWRVVTVDDIKAPEKSSCVAGPFGSSISSKYFVEVGVPVIRGNNLRADLTRFVPMGFAFVSEEQARKYKAQHVRPGDLVFTCWGTLGQVGLIPDRGPYPEYIISNKQLKLRPDRTLADPLYLFFYFVCPEMAKRIVGKAIGAAVPGINLGILKSLPVVLPPLSVQRRIASTLSAYDDLIENSRRRIRILEEMARALYREWFVEFRFPGHQSGRLVSSALGPIPLGWGVRTLASLVRSHIGGGWGKEFPEGNHREAAWVIRGTDIMDARYCNFGSVPFRYHTQSNLRSRRLEPGDIVFEVSGGSKGQPVGRALLVSPQLLAAFGDHPVICASFCKRVQPNDAEYGCEQMYFSFLAGYASGEIEQFQVQSTGISNFKWAEYLRQTSRAVPPEHLRLRYRDIVSPVLSQIAALGLQVTNLRRTRDTLLPRLLSGQIGLVEPAA